MLEIRAVIIKNSHGTRDAQTNMAAGNYVCVAFYDGDFVKTLEDKKIFITVSAPPPRLSLSPFLPQSFCLSPSFSYLSLSLNFFFLNLLFLSLPSLPPLPTAFLSLLLSLSPPLCLCLSVSLSPSLFPCLSPLSHLSLSFLYLPSPFLYVCLRPSIALSLSLSLSLALSLSPLCLPSLSSILPLSFYFSLSLLQKNHQMTVRYAFIRH